MSASFKADFHELVRTTALVLRRGLGVAVVGAASVVLGASVIVGLVIAAFGIFDQTFGAASLAVLALLPALTAISLALGVVFAAFTRALEGDTGVLDAIRQALALWPFVSGPIVFVILPLPMLVVGFGVVVLAVRGSADLAPIGVLCGVGLLAVVAWLLGGELLLPAAAIMAGGQRLDVKGHDGLALAVGGTPILLTSALLGHWLLPIVDLPETVTVAILVAAAVAIVLLTAAVSVAGYATARDRLRGRGYPWMQ